MSNLRTFKTSQENNYSSDHTNQQKSKTYFNTVRDLAVNGIQEKTTGGRYNSSFYITAKDSACANRCLAGASSYETLLDVTKGSYLCSPCDTSLNFNYEMYESPYIVVNQGQTADGAASTAPIFTEDSSVNVVDGSFNYFYSACEGEKTFVGNYAVDLCNNNIATDAPGMAGTLMHRNETLQGFQFPTRIGFQ